MLPVCNAIENLFGIAYRISGMYESSILNVCSLIVQLSELFPGIKKKPAEQMLAPLMSKFKCKITAFHLFA